jgi:hypothetical protein
MTYKHTQIGRLLLAGCFGIAIFFEFLPVPHALRPIAFPIFTFVALTVVILMGTLTVEVDDAQVRLRFGVGMVRKHFRLDEIASCRPVRNKWWWGWGIRLIPGGWLYNVSGLDAVELVLKNGKVFRIGTDEPQVLNDFIQLKLGLLP